MTRRTLGLLLAAVIGAGVWCLLVRKDADAQKEVRASTWESAPLGSNTRKVSQFETPRTSPDVSASQAGSTSHLTLPNTQPANPNGQSENGSPGIEIAIAPATLMENVRSVFQQYRAQFGGNPVGDNHEITACLNGANPRHARFIRPDDGLRVNERGELVDNWGMPFFFHQISRNEMEIRSAGPDRKMWSKDDLILK